MLPLWVNFSIGLLALLIGSITDFQKREVPDFVNFSLIITGISIGAINSVSSMTWWPLINSIGGLVAGYLVAALLFYSGQWGGGDAKMLMGLGALHGVPLTGAESIILQWSWPLFATLVIGILVLGSIYSMGYFFTMIILRFKILKKELRKKYREKKVRIAHYIALDILGLGILGSILLSSPFAWLSFILSVVISGGIVLVFVAHTMQEKILVKTTRVQDLVPGDWPVEKILHKGKEVVAVGNIGLTEEHIQTLQNSAVKTVTVKEGVPFVPGMLLGYLSIVIFGNWILFIQGLLLLYF